MHCAATQAKDATRTHASGAKELARASDAAGAAARERDEAQSQLLQACAAPRDA
jgi:hypothetical protein